MRISGIFFYRFFSLILLPCIILSGCKKDDITAPSGNLPPGYQQDISWSSLDGSPWPIYHGDAQSTGRSRYTGPLGGVIASKIPVDGMQGGISLGRDSGVYFVDYSNGILYSTDLLGNIKWNIFFGTNSSSTPIVTQKGSIIFHTGTSGKVIAVDKNGTIQWEFKPDNPVFGMSMGIGLDAALYFVDNQSTLYALGSDGKLKWKLSDKRIMPYLSIVPVLSPDGKTLYLQGDKVSLIAVDLTSASVKWVFGNETVRSSPVIDCNGNIYLMPGEYAELNVFSALNPDGSIKWQHKFYGHVSNNVEPTIDKNGNIYFGDDTLYSFTYMGDLRWTKSLQNNRFINTSLVCDKNSNVFFGAMRDNFDNYIIAVNSEGKTLWEIPVKDERSLGSSPAITANGEIAFPNFRSNHILVIK